MDQRQVAGVSLEDVLAHTNDGFCVLDRDRRFVYFNSGCERLTGFRASEVVGTGCHCADVADCADEQGRSLAGRLCPGLTVMRGEATSVRQRVRITSKSGEERWVQAVYTSLVDPEGKPEYVIVVMRDITEEKGQEEQWIKTIAELREEVDRLREDMRAQYGFAGTISRSPHMKVVQERIRAACSNSSPVLICGETGTGKEMVARTIHCNGLEHDGPFVTMNVSATPAERADAELFGYAQGSIPGATSDYAGLYRAADGGTLFIKDVDRLPSSTQAKLLQTIQDRSVRAIGSTTQVPANVRVIAASSRSVEDLVSSGALREDLYYRLSVITIEMPPLRSRKEDIPLLVEHFIGQLNSQSTRKVTEIAPEVWAALNTYDWPGNVRELQNVIESTFAASNGSVLQPEVLNLAGGHARGGRQEASGASISLDEVLCDTERRAILAALRRARGQRSLAAKYMGISRSRLYRRMDALGIASKKDLR